MIAAKFLAVALIGYFLGAIPFGVMIARRSAKVDVTSFGSGKTGATNVLRVAGKKAAAIVIVFDVLKGVLPVIFAALIFNGEYLLTSSTSPWWLSRSAQVVGALAAIAGHKWSIFLHFGGGRGVATFFGGLLALCPPAGLFGAEILFLGVCLTRYASLGSISGAVAAYAILIPLTLLNGFPVEFLVYALVGAVFIIVVHRDNISRLLAGTERRIGERVKT
jgi:glycerol-3-phosphate acyltransferase PlsY